jgi:prefoldin subunit 5
MSKLTPAQKEYNDAVERYEKNKEFLEKVAEGEYASMKALAEEANAAKAARQYPFQGTASAPSSTFQPQLSHPPYERSNESW